MELFEVSDKQRMRREDAAKRLHAIADSLERHNELRFQREGKAYTVKVPDEVVVKIELEVGDESELEVEIKW